MYIIFFGNKIKPVKEVGTVEFTCDHCYIKSVGKVYLAKTIQTVMFIPISKGETQVFLCPECGEFSEAVYMGDCPRK